MPIGNFPGSFESANLSRDDLSREIGRTAALACLPSRSRRGDDTSAVMSASSLGCPPQRLDEHPLVRDPDPGHILSHFPMNVDYGKLWHFCDGPVSPARLEALSEASSPRRSEARRGPPALLPRAGRRPPRDAGVPRAAGEPGPPEPSLVQTPARPSNSGPSRRLGPPFFPD